jgi:hypothetical protein
MNPSLDGVYLKLRRAQTHLEAVEKMVAPFLHAPISLVPKLDTELNLVVQRVKLPDPPPELSAVVGDCLFNLRCVLDYLIWQLVLINGGEPSRSNMFPITSTPQNFALEISKKRLQGVSGDAQKIIEQMQPYHPENEVLKYLNGLHNLDKHRRLNLLTAVASDTMLHDPGSGFTLYLGEEELCHGSVFGGIGVPAEMASRFPRLMNEVRGEASAFIAVEDPDAKYAPSAEEFESLNVRDVLHDLFFFVRHSVIAEFEHLFTKNGLR